MKLIMTIALVTAVGLTYLTGFNHGFNQGEKVTKQYDPQCKLRAE